MYASRATFAQIDAAAIDRHFASPSTTVRTEQLRFFGVALPSHGVPIYTDARHYAAAGVATVLYGAGPRTLAEANGHRADERLRLDDLARATDVVALALAELLAPRQKAR